MNWRFFCVNIQSVKNQINPKRIAMSMIPQNSQNSTFQSPFIHVARELQFKRCIYLAGFKKVRGPSSHDMIMAMLDSILMGKNLRQTGMSSLGCMLPTSPKSLYAFMQGNYGNWQKLAFNVGKAAMKKTAAWDDKNDFCIVVDDTILEYANARHMEGCTYTYDHNQGTNVKGYTLLAFGWTDGKSFYPMGCKLISSKEERPTKAGKPIRACKEQKVKACDGRSIQKKIRDEAREEKPQLVANWISNAVKQGVKARFVLMDSWFNYKPLMQKIKGEGLDVIGIIKQDKRNYCWLNRNGQIKAELDLKGLAELLTRMGRKKSYKDSTILGEMFVIHRTQDEELKDGIKLKLVFVRDRNDAEKFIVIASTDLTLKAEKIIQLYCRRWGIEVNFRNQKQFLGLGSECVSTDFDSLNAFCNLSCIRETLLEYRRRTVEDYRALGDLCRQWKEAVREIPLVDAISSLILLFKDLGTEIHERGWVAKEHIYAVNDYIFDKLSSWFKGSTRYLKNLFKDYRPDISEKLKPA